MTKEEFLEEVNTWGSLWRTCADVWIRGCDPMDDIIPVDHMDERIFDDIHECDYTWREIRERLNETYDKLGSLTYGAYRYNGWLDYSGLTNKDFEEVKDRVFKLISSQGGFDNDKKKTPVSTSYLKPDKNKGDSAIQDIAGSKIKVI